MGERRRLDTGLVCEQTKELSDFLSERIVNQPRAVKCVVTAYDSYISPLWRPEKPILSALFLGPSAVGKTYLPEILAEYFFDNPNAITKIECANYTERHETSRLIGASPGYIGYDEPPILSQDNIDRPAIEYAQNYLFKTDKEAQRLAREIEEIRQQIQKSGSQTASDMIMQLRQKYAQFQAYMQEKTNNKPPISIILFDEIEKADPALHHFLLEVTSKGRTRLSNGDETLFHNSFIFMTSNAGSRAIAEIVRGKKNIGFAKEEAPKPGSDPIYANAMAELRKRFTTEFLGRIEKNIIVFRNLNRENIRKIIDIQISNLLTYLAKTFPLELIISSEVKEFILEKASDHPEYGARLINDKIEKYLKEPLSRVINSGQAKKADRIHITLEDNRVCFINEVMPNQNPVIAPTPQET